MTTKRGSAWLFSSGSGVTAATGMCSCPFWWILVVELLQVCILPQSLSFFTCVIYYSYERSLQIFERLGSAVAKLCPFLLNFGCEMLQVCILAQLASEGHRDAWHGTSPFFCCSHDWVQQVQKLRVEKHQDHDQTCSSWLLLSKRNNKTLW